MNKKYYDRLIKKLETTYKRCIENNESTELIELSKRELEDLHYLFKHQAPIIWKINEKNEELE